MKKVYLLFICLVFISSCNDDLVMERNDILSTNNIEISIHDSLLMNKDLVLKKDFAKALSKVFVASSFDKPDNIPALIIFSFISAIFKFSRIARAIRLIERL